MTKKQKEDQQSKTWQWWIEKVLMPILLAVVSGYFLVIASGIIDNPFRSQPTPTNMPTDTPMVTPNATIPIVVPATPASDIISEATPTEVATSHSIQVMDQYYKYINNASIRADLSRAWDLLTQKLQCNPSDQCNFENFANFWWDFQIEYKLYDCESNIVDAELIYYTRNTPPPVVGKNPAFLRYTLFEDNGQLKLYAAEIVDGISAYCPLIVTYP